MALLRVAVMRRRGRPRSFGFVFAERVSGLISTVINQGQMRFMVYREAMNANLMIKFLGRLVKVGGRKVFLILDNLKGHHSKPVKERLAKHQEQIEVFYLPAYCPELNPDEYLNNVYLKTGVYRASWPGSGCSCRRKRFRICGCFKNNL